MSDLVNKKEHYNFFDLLELMEILRGENGCPWDREQTHESIKGSTLEEAYEVVEAINNKDNENLKEELGDLLLHVVFHSKIAKEHGNFSISDVIDGIVTKLIRRHPHVFVNEVAIDADEVIEKWEEIKKKEKEYKLVSEALESVPQAFPSLLRARKVQKKAASVGFDFTSKNEVMDKLEEEVTEFKEAVELGDISNIEIEFGDILFTFVNISRFFNLNPEICLTNAIEKFINRFKGVEELAKNNGKTIDTMTVEELDKLWNKVKSQ